RCSPWCLTPFGSQTPYAHDRGVRLFPPKPDLSAAKPVLTMVSDTFRESDTVCDGTGPSTVRASDRSCRNRTCLLSSRCSRWCLTPFGSQTPRRYVRTLSHTVSDSRRVSDTFPLERGR